MDATATRPALRRTPSRTSLPVLLLAGTSAGPKWGAVSPGTTKSCAGDRGTEWKGKGGRPCNMLPVSAAHARWCPQIDVSKGLGAPQLRLLWQLSPI
jgi:hypothetical protein